MLVPVSVVTQPADDRDYRNRSKQRKQKNKKVNQDEPHPHEDRRGDVIDLTA